MLELDQSIFNFNVKFKVISNKITKQKTKLFII